MKRIDLKDGETAFFYNGQPDKPPPDITPEQMREGGELISQIMGPPLRSATAVMSLMSGRTIQGAFVMFEEDGRLVGLTATADGCEEVVKALEQALARMREARMKEIS